MLGLRFSRLVHAAIATGSLGMTGCVDRVIVDPTLGTIDTDGGTDSGSASDTDSGPDPTDPTSPTTDPTNPTDPTSPTGPGPTTATTGPQPMPGPPMLIDAEIIEPNVIELYFSEPMADPSGVDPAKFRLSAAWSRHYSYYGDEWGGTYYQEVGRLNGEEVCMEECWCDYYDYDYCYYGPEYCQEWCYTQPGPPVTAIALQLHPVHSSRMLLTIDNAITSSVCRRLDDYADFADSVGLFVHYTNNGSPDIDDTDSEQLDAIAEHWTLPPREDWAYMQGDFPAMPMLIPISCPF